MKQVAGYAAVEKGRVAAKSVMFDKTTIYDELLRVSRYEIGSVEKVVEDLSDSALN